MKAYKVELLILDFDQVGDDIQIYIENARYPNHCLSPQVMDIKCVDIGEWRDDHPLNKFDTMQQEYNKLFKNES